MSEEPTRLDQARTVMREMYGAEWKISVRPGEPENSAELTRLLLEHTFTDSWAREGLDRRSKCLLTITIFAVLGQHQELRNHVSGALMNGVSKEEIVEALIHIGAYCGPAVAAPAWAAVRDVIAAFEPGA